MPHIPHLLAAGDWWRLLFIVLFFVIPLLSKLLGGKNEAVPDARRVKRRPVPPQPPVPGQNVGRQEAAAVGQEGAGSALEDEIEAFLRRSRGEKPRSKPVPQARPEPPEEIRRLVEKPQSIKQQESATQPKPPRESVSEHVERHISSHPVSDQGRELGRKLGETDEALESHLHQVFDHKIGLLSKEDSTQFVHEGTDDTVWDTAEDKRQKRTDAMGDRSELIIRMLSNPESIKQAVILGEVLKRPDFD